MWFRKQKAIHVLLATWNSYVRQNTQDNIDLQKSMIPLRVNGFSSFCSNILNIYFALLSTNKEFTV